MRKILIIGAGAAGMMAAYSAKKCGADVTVLEKNAAAGRKINATGNGRCNFTNLDAMNVEHYHSKSISAVEAVLKQFTVQDILGHFDMLGLMPRLEENGKYFPMSGQASSVSELFERKLIDMGVKIEYGINVDNIVLNNDGVRVTAGERLFVAERLIIATGGKAAPDTGSDGAGLAFAEKIGHSIVETLPVIVQMKTKNGFYKRINGIRVDAMASLVCDGRVIRTEQGDVMFYDYGLSGPPVFQLSCNAAPLLAKGKRVFVELDFFADISKDKLEAYIFDICKAYKGNMKEVLCGLINKKLIEMLLEDAGISGNALACTMDKKDIEILCRSLKRYSAEIIGTKGWENAQSTYGGVSLDEVDENTLRSRINGKISFCGEILDVAGDCGGYNLTWAWSSGYVCGMHAAL